MEAGFIGLGAMGHAMATSLVRAGHQLRVWNRTPQKAKDLQAAGARFAESPAAAAQAGVVLTMLADDAAVGQVLEGAEGLLAGLPKDGLHVSMSTISYELCER